jgi:hypothetical protein
LSQWYDPVDGLEEIAQVGVYAAELFFEDAPSLITLQAILDF